MTHLLVQVGLCLLLVLALLAQPSSSLLLRVGGLARRAAVGQLWSTSVKSGQHGQGFRFMPMTRTSKREHFPRILPIAGVFPGLSTAELLAPPPAASAPPGMWTYDFSDVTGVQLGKVAIPGSEPLSNAVDPVVLISTNTALKIQAVTELEVLLVVDRRDPDAWDPDCFYLLRSVQPASGAEELQVLWCESPPPDMEVLGKVVTAVLPWVPSMQKPSSGFAEEDEDEDD